MSDLGNKEIMGKNIQKYMKKKNIDRHKLSDDLNVKYTTLSDWINAKTYPRIDKIELMANYFGIQKSDLVEDSSTLKNKVIHFQNSNSYNYFDTGLSAGMLMEVDPFTRDDTEQIVLSDVIMGKYAGDKDIFISHVNGESMNRVIPNESLIAIKKFQSINDLTNGDIVVFQDGGDMSIKRFYNDPNSKIITFSPDSYDVSFRPINYRYEDFGSVKIVGKVVVYTVEV